MTKETVNHPDHYGGADNPYEVIEVLEAWMTPQEVAGFLKGNVIKYLARARHKGQTEDLRKAKWYQDRLVAYAEKIGQDEVFPPILYWDNEGCLSEDEHEIVSCAEQLVPVAIHSNIESHTRWFVRIPTDEGDEVDWFFDREKAEECCVFYLNPEKKNAKRKR